VGCSPIFDAQERHAGNLVSFQDITELEHQKRKIECTLKELGESKEQLRQQNEKLHELASKDMLTGVFNRRSLFEHLENIWNMTAQKQQSMSVVMLDVDHFKKLNDGYGHAVGDQVLRDVAAVIRKSAPEKSMVARYGGEEFCVVLPLMDLSRAAEAAEAIRHAIETQLENPYRVTASIGVASNASDAESYNIMLDRADKALYSAKHSGRNAVNCWSAEIAMEVPGVQKLKSTTRSSQRSQDSESAIDSEKELAVLVEELKEIFPVQVTQQAEAPTDAPLV
jgi:diguanylate cyclase (GGDEF)-like protein